MITIDWQKCDGCAACMDACSVGAIYLVDKKAYIDQSLCTSCGNCIDVCPVQAIQSVESMVAQQTQPAEIQPTKTSLLPMLISKIGDVIIAKLESKSGQSTLPKRKAGPSGKQYRRRFRGGA